eukprot:g47550.t1
MGSFKEMLEREFPFGIPERKGRKDCEHQWVVTGKFNGAQLHKCEVCGGTGINWPELGPASRPSPGSEAHLYLPLQYFF